MKSSMWSSSVVMEAGAGTFKDLKSRVRPLIECYEDDFEVHDRRMILENPKTPFVHWTRAWGTYLQLMPASDTYPRHGEVVPYLFGVAGPGHILQQILKSAEAFASPTRTFHGARILATHYFDGSHLREISPDRAFDILSTYTAKIRREIFS